MFHILKGPAHYPFSMAFSSFSSSLSLLMKTSGVRFHGRGRNDFITVSLGKNHRISHRDSDVSQYRSAPRPTTDTYGPTGIFEEWGKIEGKQGKGERS